jgi:PTS system nitrogen regulatory IIA component
MESLFETATIVGDLKASGKRRTLQLLSDSVAADHGLDAKVIMQHLLEREQLGATGVGGGVAMPHGRIEGLKGIAVGFARLTDPIEYESPDGEPVDLIMLLLAPAEAGAVCLKALSKASRILRDPAVRERLRTAKDADEIRSILSITQDTATA